METLLNDVGKLLGDLVEAPQGVHDDAHLIIDEQLQLFWTKYYGLKQRHEDEALSVAVLALTKSGKSTLLNALIGSDCLPVNNVPETARIAKLIHLPPVENPEPYMLEDGRRVSGTANIRSRLQELNSEVRSRQQQIADEQVVQIFAPFASISSMENVESDMKMHLLDTPGPNEAGEEGLKYQVERLLDKVDAVIYLMDYTKLKTAEEAEIFRRLKQINPTLVQRLSQRLFFVVNKGDQVLNSEGLSEEETKEYVATLVTKQLSCEGFQLSPDQVLLISARDALLSRLVMSGTASQETQQRFQHIAFGSRCRQNPTIDQMLEAARSILIESGVLELEERIVTYLFQHRSSVKLLATVDDIVRLLQAVTNVAASCKAALESNASTLRIQADELRNELEQNLVEFDEVVKDTEDLRVELTDQIRHDMGDLKTRLFSHLHDALDSDEGPRSQPRGWRRVRDRFLGFFTSKHASSSKDELCSTLLDLHETILSQIHQEVADFWHVLEACTNARQRQLLLRINRQLDMLSRRVESSVSEKLCIRLEPVDITFQPPSAEEFHSDLQELLNRGVVEQTEQHIRVNTRDVQDRELRWRHDHGMCRWGAYFVNVPRQRTVVEAYNKTVFRLQPNEVRGHFVEMIDSAVEASQRAVSAYVGQYLRQKFAQARMQIEEYGDRYLSSMTSALETSHKGQEARAMALRQTEALLLSVSALKGRVLSLQKEAEDLMPHVGTVGEFDHINAADMDLEDDALNALVLDMERESPDLAGSSGESSPELAAAADAELAAALPPVGDAATAREAAPGSALLGETQSPGQGGLDAMLAGTDVDASLEGEPTQGGTQEQAVQPLGTAEGEEVDTARAVVAAAVQSAVEAVSGWEAAHSIVSVALNQVVEAMDQGTPARDVNAAPAALEGVTAQGAEDPPDVALIQVQEGAESGEDHGWDSDSSGLTDSTKLDESESAVEDSSSDVSDSLPRLLDDSESLAGSTYTGESTYTAAGQSFMSGAESFMSSVPTSPPVPASPQAELLGLLRSAAVAAIPVETALAHAADEAGPSALAQPPVSAEGPDSKEEEEGAPALTASDGSAIDPDKPFDYGSGFALAMTTKHLSDSMSKSPSGTASEDDWMMVDEQGGM